MAITGETRIIDLPEKSSLVEGDFFVVDNENGATSKIPAAAVSGSATAGLVAKEYSNASTYAVGEYCIHVESGLPKLYKCTTAITTAEAWNSAHWTQTDAGSELTTANEDIASLNFYLTALQKNDLGSGVDISSYTTTDNLYTCPSDGYILMNASSSTSTWVNAEIYGSTSNNSFVVSASNGRSGLFVRKGMRLRKSGSGGTSPYIYFYPLQ